MNLVTAHIDFLLDDVKSDAEFHEGGQVNGVKVFASMSQMRERISHILGVPILDVGLWHNQNCTIQFNGFRDREIPGKPLCHGKIMVTGTRENVEGILALLEGTLPEITKEKHLRAYSIR